MDYNTVDMAIDLLPGRWGRLLRRARAWAVRVALFGFVVLSYANHDAAVALAGRVVTAVSQDVVQQFPPATTTSTTAAHPLHARG